MNTVETREFQAEARQLLQLMVHSIYSNKDVFLRELLSNASDALDKLRLASLTGEAGDADTGDLHIELIPDTTQRTLTVRDNGIGMSRDEVVELIGTIAKSGTAELLAKLRESQQAEELIGQFGVGFYSAFMVADKVTMVTRRADDTGGTAGTRWESDGSGTYTLETVEDAPQGTAVTLHLKPADEDDQLHDYTAEQTLRGIVTKYSDFLAWPIRMTLPAKESDGESGDAPEVATLNSMKALWARPKDEVEDAEYHEFYKHISHDWMDPLEVIRLQAEGTFEYQALLFIPSRAPFDLFSRDGRRGVQLYVKRVFIMDDCESLVPEYLRFVKGVVDAQDLSLNVSREILQQDRHIQLMRKRLAKRVIAAVRGLLDDDAEKYRTFWSQFGQAVKEGLVTDPDNRDSILEIASFASTGDPEALTTLAEYRSRMQDGQEHIYYLTGRSRAAVENSPQMEAFTAKGIEVLILTEPVDEMWVDAVGEYEGTPLRSVAKGELDLDDEDQPEREEFAGLLDWLGSTLADTVKQVRLSARLTSSPACIVGDDNDFSPELEKMYRAMGQPLPETKRILELNPKHPLVTGLRDAHRDRPDDAGLTELAELIYGSTVLAEGGELPDPARFARLLSDRLTSTL